MVVLNKELAEQVATWIEIAEQGTSNLLLAEALTIIREQRRIIGLRDQFVADTCEGFDCLPTCNSDCHDELCPLTNPIVAWRQMQSTIANHLAAFQEIDRMEKFRNYEICPDCDTPTQCSQEKGCMVIERLGGTNVQAVARKEMRIA